MGEQQLLGKVDSKTSVLDNGKLQSHMIRLAHLSQHGGDSAGTKDALYITHEKELHIIFIMLLSLIMTDYFKIIFQFKFVNVSTLEFTGKLKVHSSNSQSFSSLDIERRKETE